MSTFRKLSFIMALLRTERKNFEERVQLEVLRILNTFGDTDDFVKMSPYVSQALNFFVINTLESENEAKDLIASTIFEKGDPRRALFFPKDGLIPSKLVAGVAYLFREIQQINFDRGFHGSDEEFQSVMIRETSRVSENLLKLFPENKEYWNAFVEFFTKKYLSPWNHNRYDYRKTSANFGTGVDYIM